MNAERDVHIVKTDVVPTAVSRALPDLGTPHVESAGYSLTVFLHRVWPDGQHEEDYVPITHADPERVRAALGHAAERLAWFHFVGEVQVTMSHSHEVATHGTFSYLTRDPNQQTETITGRPFSIGDAYYVVDKHPDGELTVLSGAEVRHEGRLRPYMATWLGALAARRRYSTPDTREFSSWLDR